MEILLVREGCFVCIGSSKPCKCINYGIYTVRKMTSLQGAGEFPRDGGERSLKSNRFSDLGIVLKQTT